MTNRWYDSKPGRTGCGPGWDKIIFPLIERCKAEGVEISQIKEKFGGLRFYIDMGNEALFDAIDAAEDLSLETCEECGEPGKPRSGGWIKTLCDKCATARNEKYKSTRVP